MLCAIWIGSGCEEKRGNSVVVYASQDQVYAEPILREFETRTGIEVRTVFDSEAVKTVGLANRLLAEQKSPGADLFWNNEELRTRQLAAKGVFAETNGWWSFGIRTRSLVVNQRLWNQQDPSPDLSSLTNARWKGKIALAYPLFGSTATHFLVLKQRWGSDRWRAWCAALAANEPRCVDGNSVVVQLVSRGEAVLGLTDSDDIAAGIREGLPIREVELGIDGLKIPNTVGVIRGARHPEAAAQLAAYLRSEEVQQRLMKAQALKAISTLALPVPGSEPPVDWEKILSDLSVSLEQLRTQFLR